ncbi:uncharacterized protein TEOVI_000844300 [Trypanosoma equiperdum]|uniref:Uncharacterized protein n=2 Tax=Trypanozoon TaxID=39700 RepID=Q582X9_TRYB2|nr:hypothetical protein, conserved [Trypanosoma brucei brucei TREU927]AAX80710.1 hypothetical protein, conserved [Trypanosoma brucei]AAZ10301.1 hypothetical protein, conserved [Trypanosoma brucei brucei TREU927]SCU64611.1 hypothetical protein, conserved [Trypanosoma equiperdum]
MQRLFFRSTCARVRCADLRLKPPVSIPQVTFQTVAFSSSAAGAAVRSGAEGTNTTTKRRSGFGGGAGGGGPVKDRYPPPATDLGDPRRRLAVLVDASSVDPRVFRNTILPAALKVGTPVLIRIFSVQLSSEWEPLVAGSGGTRESATSTEPEWKTSGTANDGREEVSGAAGSRDSGAWCPPVEFFRVERFIPVPMQMEADANHIFDFRKQNQIEAVAFVCGEVDRGVFEGFLPNIAGNGFNQYVLDELGMAKEVLEDGRSEDGTPTVQK